MLPTGNTLWPAGNMAVGGELAGVQGKRAAPGGGPRLWMLSLRRRLGRAAPAAEPKAERAKAEQREAARLGDVVGPP